MAEEKTVIQGELISSKANFPTPDYYTGHRFNLLLFVQEETTNNPINIRYTGDTRNSSSSYYENFYECFIKPVGNKKRFKLTIRGILEEDKLEYEGIGLIKLLSEK